MQLWKDTINKPKDVCLVGMILTMDFKLQFVYWCTNVFMFVNADDFKHFTGYFQYYSIRRDMDMSIAANTHTAVSLLQCSVKCTMDVSLSLYFVEENQRCQCNNDTDVSTEEDPGKPEVVYGQVVQIVQVLKDINFTTRNVIPPKVDCLDLHKLGFYDDGVYTIQPLGQTPVDTWCDMKNGGWTVIQRRFDGSEDFYRGWSDYVSGFGNRTGEYWLGLDNIHSLTSQSSELYIYAEAFEGKQPQSAYANYSDFIIYGSSHNYRLYVGGFTGTCGDPLSPPTYHAANGMKFSTYDRDNDAHAGGNCAVSFRGAWWYKACHSINPNGFYYGGDHTSYGDGVDWKMCWGYYYSVKKIIMAIRVTS